MRCSWNLNLAVAIIVIPLSASFAVHRLHYPAFILLATFPPFLQDQRKSTLAIGPVT